MLYFSFMVMTPLLPLYLSEVFGATKDETGMVLSGYALTALLVRPFSGFFVDSFPRKLVLLACYGLFALLFGGYLVAGSLLSFCILRTLHGAPMGATTVANSTVAIDVLPSSRRAEGIGYYGLSNRHCTDGGHAHLPMDCKLRNHLSRLVHNGKHWFRHQQYAASQKETNSFMHIGRSPETFARISRPFSPAERLARSPLHRIVQLLVWRNEHIHCHLCEAGTWHHHRHRSVLYI